MRIAIPILISLVLVSCHKVKRPPKPDNLISKKEMVNIILDVSLLRSAEGTNKTKVEKEGYTIENYVYERHNIDSLQFALSNDYYSYDLETYEDIYKQVEDSLTSLKAHYESKRDSVMEGRKNKKKKDTLSAPRQRMFRDSLQETVDSLDIPLEVMPQID